jgi:phospholipid/cholesterol/gamma-HCH transport system substrate-binding protein
MRSCAGHAVNTRRRPPYKTAGAVLLLVLAGVLALVYAQFRGALTSVTVLTLLSDRAGLSLDVGAKVTYNGVQIGRLDEVSAVTIDGRPKARLLLDIDPRYATLIPSNVDADIRATTVFGNKYVAFSSPLASSHRPVATSDVIEASTVSTEYDTLFETLLGVSQKVDPVKLNQTLTATAQALDGLGTRFGQSITDANVILADLNDQMPRIRDDLTSISQAADTYADAAPDLFDALEHRAHPDTSAVRPRRSTDGVRRLRQYQCPGLRARRPLPHARRTRQPAHDGFVRRIQPGAGVHHPRLCQRRTEGQRRDGR